MRGNRHVDASSVQAGASPVRDTGFTRESTHEQTKSRKPKRIKLPKRSVHTNVSLQAFESQNGSKPKPAQSGSDQSSADAPDSTPTDEASEEKPAILFKNKKEKTNKNEQTAGENVAGAKTKTQDESPRKLKYPLGKARSAGLLEASNTDSGSSPEFAGVQRRPHRALSEKTPKVGGALHEKDEQQNESTSTFVRLQCFERCSLQVTRRCVARSTHRLLNEASLQALRAK